MAIPWTKLWFPILWRLSKRFGRQHIKPRHFSSLSWKDYDIFVSFELEVGWEKLYYKIYSETRTVDRSSVSSLMHVLSLNNLCFRDKYCLISINKIMTDTLRYPWNWQTRFIYDLHYNVVFPFVSFSVYKGVMSFLIAVYVVYLSLLIDYYVHTIENYKITFVTWASNKNVNTLHLISWGRRVPKIITFDQVRS